MKNRNEYFSFSNDIDLNTFYFEYFIVQYNVLKL